MGCAVLVSVKAYVSVKAFKNVPVEECSIPLYIQALALCPFVFPTLAKKPGTQRAQTLNVNVLKKH